MTAITADRPAHIPASLVRDFDFYNIPNMESDVHSAWKHVQDESPDIFWTPHYGGHWVACRAEDIERMQTDSELFSYAGISIPRNSTPSYPLELDPPVHGPVRAIINPLFSPGVIRTLEGKIRNAAIDLIQKVYAAGKCEFIGDFGRRLPIDLFLGLVELPLEDRDMLLDLGDARVRETVPEKRDAAKHALLKYLEQVVAQRKATPGKDVLSSIVNAKLNGAPIDAETLQNLLSLVMFGGLDTVASMLGFFALYLAKSPALRKDLIDFPERIPAVLDELLRRNGIIATSRTVRHDMEYKGIQFRAGEQILAANILHGLDERKFPDPMSLDFNRPNARDHAVFGNGVHRCPGANLARVELRIFIEEWLKHIPDFSLDPASPPVMGAGVVNAVLKLPLVWDVVA